MTDNCAGKVATSRISGVPVTKGKLVEEISKRVQWHIGDLEDNGDVSY